MTQLNETILICEDDADSRELLRFVFELEGFAITACDNDEECLAKAQKGGFQAIVLDNRLGDVSSVDLCRRIRGVHATVPIIFYSGEARKTEIEKALMAGANDYLIKPLDFERLTHTINQLIEKNR